MAARPWRLVGLLLALLLGLSLLAILLIFDGLRPAGPPGQPIDLLAHGELRIGVDASFPPFAVAADSDLSGLDIDLGRAIGAKLDVPVRFVNMGFDGLYDSLRANQVDVLISALLVDPARQDAVMYTRSYFDAGLVIVSAAERPFATFSSLSGQRLAYEFGSSADGEARKWLRRVQPFETLPYELPQHALDAVRLGQADAALVDAVTARLYLRENGAWLVEQHYVTEALYAVATRRDRFELWAAMNYAVQELIDDGTLDELLARWL